jgi:hypothetical protein
VHRRHGGFDASAYSVERLGEAAARAYVEAEHYSRSWPAAVARFGLWHHGRGAAGREITSREITSREINGDSAPDRAVDVSAGGRSDDAALVGVAVFGVPAQAKVLTNVFPGLEPYRESLELSRLVLEGPAHCGVGRAPANAETWFVARCLRELADDGVRGVVSFSDPVPRVRSDGTVVMPGHVGIVYQASNAVCLGRATARQVWVLPDATVLHERAMSKVRRLERGHEYVERRLVALGARVRPDRADPQAWLRDALLDVGARPVRHEGNWRYAFVTGRTRRERSRVEVRGEVCAYPKQPDVTWS